jgi:hypothetical protein
MMSHAIDEGAVKLACCMYKVVWYCVGPVAVAVAFPSGLWLAFSCRELRGVRCYVQSIRVGWGGVSSVRVVAVPLSMVRARFELARLVSSANLGRSGPGCGGHDRVTIGSLSIIKTATRDRTA